MKINYNQRRKLIYQALLKLDEMEQIEKVMDAISNGANKPQPLEEIERLENMFQDKEIYFIQTKDEFTSEIKEAIFGL
jgi:hypothetical protein